MITNQNIKLKKFRIPLIAIALGFGGVFLFTYLTFIPKQTFAINGKRTLSDISKMEELTPWICYNSEDEESNLLEDTRDHRKYWVTKLADGNCWMTQNLDYDLLGVSSSPITNWTNSSGGVTNATIAYFDPGDYLYKPATNAGQNGNCASSGITSFSCPAQFGSSTVDRKNLEDAKDVSLHRHVGNYYSWLAAVNTTSALVPSNDGGNVTNTSICPNGDWKLPTSGSGISDPGSFQALVTAYTISKPSTTSAFYGDPMYFVWGGALYSGKLNLAGNRGYYWSSTSQSSTRAYDLIFDTDIAPAYNNARYDGMSVRCLVLASSEPDIPPVSSNATISVTVAPVISIDVSVEASNADKMDVDFTRVATSNIVTSVSSNYQYTVSISTEQSNLEQTSPTEHNIPMISAGSDVKEGTNGWGIKKKKSALANGILGDTDDDTKYSPVGLGTGNPEVFYKSAGAEALTVENKKPLTFEVGVGVDAKLPSGKYSTLVMLTASVI